jgi:hypothetical protein
MTLPGPFYLNNVLVTPDNWCSMEFDPFNLSMKDLSTQNVITRCNSSGPLYTMHLPSRSTPSSFAAAPSTLLGSTSTSHRRFGHSSIDALSKLANASSIICSRCTHDLCHACQLGHHTRMPFVSSTSPAYNNFDLIHCDLWTSPIVSISMCKYYLVILDDRSHFVWTFPLCMKSDTVSTLSNFSPLLPHSLVAPSKSSSVTMAVSSTTPPPTHFLPLVGSSCRCHVHRPLRRMVKPSTLFAPSII